jgi:hypothetical protein
MPVPRSVAPARFTVDYQNGALAISADDAPLQEIFDRIRDVSGARVEASGLDERVTVRLAAQPPVRTIAALLEGNHLNYAILGGATEQEPLRLVIVSPVPPAGPVTAAVPTEEIEAARRAQAQRFQAETGGDEGVWEPPAEVPNPQKNGDPPPAQPRKPPQ